MPVSASFSGDRLPHDVSSQGKTLGLAATMVTAFIWAWPTIFIKILASDFDIFTQSFYRYLASGAFLGALCFLLMRDALVRAVSRIRLLLIPAILVSLFQMTSVAGVYMTNASLAGLVNRMSMAFIVVLSYIFFESERRVMRSRYFVLANFLIVAGVFGLVLGAPEVNLEFNMGVILTIVSAFFWGAYVVSIKQIVNDFEALAAMPIVQLLASAVFLPIVLFFGDITRVASVGWAVNLLLVGSGIVCVGLGNVTNYVAIRHLGATLPANIMTFKPLLTIVFAYFILGELLTIAQVLSGILLLMGCWVIIRKVTVRYGEQSP